MRCTAVLCGSKEKSQHNQWLGHCPLIYHWQSLQPPFENYKSKMLSLQSAPLQTEIWNCKRNFVATTVLLQPQHGQTGSEKINKFASTKLCLSYLQLHNSWQIRKCKSNLLSQSLTSALCSCQCFVAAKVGGSFEAENLIESLSTCLPFLQLQTCILKPQKFASTVFK